MIQENSHTDASSHQVILSLLAKASERHASDLLLSSGKKPVMRFAGKLESQPFDMTVQMLTDFRRMVLDEAQEANYMRQSYMDTSFSMPGGKHFRFNFFETVRGPSLAVRPIGNGDDLNLESLHLPSILNQLAAMPRGLILFAGATGSGKSTSMGALITLINKTRPCHILTLEDPVEYLFTDNQATISQREIDTNKSGGFSDALRSALRENPDVIVVGEMRDTETIRTALIASLTGHLVISTVHTADTVQAVQRIVNMFPMDQQAHVADDLSLALNGILVQRLIPEIGRTKMIPAFEILLGTGLVRKLIALRDYSALENALNRNVEQGMIPFKRSIYRLYGEKHISLQDAMEASTNREEFALLIKGMEVGMDAFRNYYGTRMDDTDENIVDMRVLFHAAYQTHSSDLILTSGARPTLRINGELRELDMPVLNSDDVQRLLYGIINQHQRTILEETRELDFALSVDLHKKSNSKPAPLRFRINAFYQRGSLGMVARLVNLVIPDYHTLGIPDSLMNLMKKKQGLILVGGPTGSGKSTTLACLIDHVNRNRNAHIITIEDPVEYVFNNQNSVIEQRELHDDTLSFAAALKYALREAPDVIMLGEMRDQETIAAALTAAETGHLVLATIHANSAPEAVDRIVDSFPHVQQNQIRSQLASVILASVSQRLIPRIDIAKGRIAAFEIMTGSFAVRSLIREGKTFQLPSIIETSQKDGMVTMQHALEDLCNAGFVSKEEAERFAFVEKEISAFL